MYAEICDTLETTLEQFRLINRDLEQGDVAKQQLLIPS